MKVACSYQINLRGIFVSRKDAEDPSKRAKFIIGNEATGQCSCRVIRGGWEQRASKVKSETWEIPCGGQIGGKNL